MKYKHKRHFKNYLIAPKEQFLFGFFILTLVILAGGTHTLLLIKKIRNLRETGQLFENGVDSELVVYILQSFAVTSLMLGIFIFLVNILFTHRVFGSLHVIEKHFRSAAEEGKPVETIPSRKYDMTTSLVESINSYFKKTPQEKNEK